MRLTEIQRKRTILLERRILLMAAGRGEAALAVREAESRQVRNRIGGAGSREQAGKK